jgi:hypothetical protein
MNAPWPGPTHPTGPAGPSPSGPATPHGPQPSGPPPGGGKSPSLGTGAPWPSHPTGPTGPAGPTGPGRPADEQLLTDIDCALVGLLATAYFGPCEQGTAAAVEQACAAEVLLFRLRMARRAVADLRAVFESPARRDPSSAAVGPVVIATPGGPVIPPVRAGEEPTPGSAAAIRSAVRESRGHLVAAKAGASFRLPMWPGTVELARRITASVRAEKAMPPMPGEPQPAPDPRPGPHPPPPIGNGRPLYDALPPVGRCAQGWPSPSSS